MTTATKKKTDREIRRFTVEEYHRMGETGVLKPDERVELIEGEVVRMPPIRDAHAACVKRLNRLFGRNLGDRAIVSVQDPVILGDKSETQPDIALHQPHSDFYSSGRPTPNDILLLVEVSHTTVDFDRDVKVPLYARMGIREVWIVDIQAQAIEVHRNPSAGKYSEIKRFKKGASLSCVAFPDVEIKVAEIIG